MPFLNRQQEPANTFCGMKRWRSVNFWGRYSTGTVSFASPDGYNLYQKSSSTQAGAADARLFPVFRTSSICMWLLWMKWPLTNVACPVTIFPQINEEWWKPVQLLLAPCTTQLVGCRCWRSRNSDPSFIVLEPDYPVWYQFIGRMLPWLWTSSGKLFPFRLQPIRECTPVAFRKYNNPFPWWVIHAEGRGGLSQEMYAESFRRYPIELAASDLRDREKNVRSFDDCKLHFDHILWDGEWYTFMQPAMNRIKRCRARTFLYMRSDRLRKGDSTICNAICLPSSKTKSGKADEYAIRGKIEPKENNKVQMPLLSGVLGNTDGDGSPKVKPYLFYIPLSRCFILFPSLVGNGPSVIDLRNRIVADEYGIQLRTVREYTAETGRNHIHPYQMSDCRTF